MLAHWQEAFLIALRRTGRVSVAADLAGKDRTTVYYHRSRNRDFRQAWNRALKLYADTNVRRVIQGVPV